MKKITLILSLFSYLIYNMAISQSIATYNIVFESFWNASDHGTLPPSPHWSPLVGVNHNSLVNFLETNSIATQGIEDIAETGDVSIFRDQEVTPSINNANAEQFFNGGGLGSATGIISINGLEISENFPLLTLISMIAPSPDWIIFINDLNLRNASNTNWKNLIEIDLYVHDAGTDSGSTYNASDTDITPHIPINSLEGISPFNNNRVGKLTITLQSTLNTRNEGVFENIKIYPNPTKGNITITNLKNEDLYSIHIYNVLGKLVKKTNLNGEIFQTNINLTSLQKGIYLLHLTNLNGYSKTQKLIIR